MEKFVIQGGIPLNGEVIPAGNKNAALPLLAASILTSETIILHNVPDIRDVQVMLLLLESLGVEVNKTAPNSLRLSAKDIFPKQLDPNLCKRIRASILLAGPMIARCKEIVIPPPGGDVIGRRRVDTHILAFEALGTNTKYNISERLFKLNATE